MLKLNFYKWDGGGQKATPILALHGFTGSGLDFEYFAKNTADFFSWWAPDLMGHGKSPVSEDINDYTIPAHIAYLDKIAEEISQPFILLGYSMGARLAFRYALERPASVSRLILIGITPGITDPNERKLRQESDEALANTILAEGVENFLKKWQERPLIKTQDNIPDTLRKTMYQRRLQNSSLGLANSLNAMGTGTMIPLWDRLGELKCPVTLITGQTDKKFCEIAEQMKKLVPAIIHKVFPEAGHAAIWENAGYFNSFLKLEIRDSNAL